MVKVNIYKTDGKTTDKVDLPDVFSTPYRPDLIRKSFNVIRSNKRQPYGSDSRAGAKHSTEWSGKGHGVSRVPRIRQDGRSRGALSPGTVGGRRAHPPRPDRDWSEKMNKKEKKLARNSAYAAISDNTIVQQRGHKFDEKLTLPVVIEDKFEKTKKTSDVIEILEKIGVYDDVLRAKNGKHVRAGKGKRRGRRYKTPKSLLVISDNDNVKNVCRNLPGVDVVSPELVNVEHLAPGGDPGRLTIISKSSLNKIGGAE